MKWLTFAALDKGTVTSLPNPREDDRLIANGDDTMHAYKRVQRGRRALFE